MTSPAAPEYFDITDYLRVLRRRWLVVTGLTLAGLAVATGYVFLAPKQYTAAVLVQVNALPNNANAVGGRTGGPVNMDNEAQAVRSGAVASIVKARMHSSLSTTDIASLIRVTVPPNTTYLQITCAGPTATAARRWANAVGRAYLSERRASTQTLIGTGIKALQARAASLRATIERLKVLIYSTRHSSRHPSGSPVIVGDELLLNGAQTALLSLQGHIDAAMPLYASLAAPGSVIVGTVVTPASLPASPSSPRMLLVLPSGLLAGLILGLAVAFATDRRKKAGHYASPAEQHAPGHDEGDDDPQPEPGLPGPLPAAGATMWPSRAPRASGEPPEFTSATGARRANETWPIPEVTVTERDDYADLADSAPGD